MGRKANRPEIIWERYIPEPNTGCWLWAGGNFHSFGYGHVSIKGKPIGAHRISYELTHGPIPAGLFVRHKCDQPACINPRHLEVGTQKQNLEDMVKRGRSLTGEKANRAKFTWEQIREIREAWRSGETQVSIASRYGIRQGHISDIVLEKVWKQALPL